MELFDVVDENDKVVGQATRDECHSNPSLIHRTSQFTLVDFQHKKILVTQRSFNKKTDPGKMCFLGEHVLSGETYEDAVTRGVGEELGFSPKIIKEVATHLFRFPEQTEISKFFIVNWNNETLNLTKEELISFQWLTLDELMSSEIDYSDTTKYWVKSIDWVSVL